MSGVGVVGGMVAVSDSTACLSRDNPVSQVSLADNCMPTEGQLNGLEPYSLAVGSITCRENGANEKRCGANHSDLIVTAGQVHERGQLTNKWTRGNRQL